jgi:hypothetical protein
LPLSFLEISNWTKAIEIHWSFGATTLILLIIVSTLMAGPRLAMDDGYKSGDPIVGPEI